VHGGTASQAALNWLRAKPGVTSVIMGARTLEQLEDNLGALAWEITPEEVERVDAALPPAAVYPYWMIEQFHQNR
jgi:aryl-alcohol dehydrogenase-like predicted oxidoreductase